MSSVADPKSGFSTRANPVARSAIAKVPEITAIFWVVKILTTAMGESTSDFLNQELGPAIAVPIMLIVLGVALRLQLKASRYVAWTYWLVVVAVAVFGTSAADALHVVLGIPYLISTSFYLIVLAAILTAWYVSERTLSIHSIYTRRRESFYWATVLATFALGTAAGDMTATTLHLGYLASGLMFAAWILVPAVAYLRFGVNEVLTFWFAYILTRPLGASFADWMAVAHHSGGLGFGTGAVAVTLSVLIVAFVGYLTVNRVDVEGEVAIEGEHVVPHTRPLDSHAILGAELD
jgi:uncharacterized membrane-anchored protein